MRRITILYFAAVRERAGVDREEQAIPGDVVDLRALSAWLERERPALRGALASCRFAVDEEFRPLDHPLHDGVVVAILPPVSGG